MCDIRKIVHTRASKKDWWKTHFQEEMFQNLECSGKLRLLFSILEDSEARNEKILLFSQSLHSLNIIEHFLKQKDWEDESTFFRLDGTTTIEKRMEYIEKFNDMNNSQARYYKLYRLNKYCRFYLKI